MDITRLLGEDGIAALAPIALCMGLCLTGAAASQPSAPVYHQSKPIVSQFYSAAPININTPKRFSSEHPEDTDFGPTPVAEPTETIFYGLYRRREI